MLRALVIRIRQRCATLVWLAAFWALASQAHAQTLQAPIGGQPIPLGGGVVACGPVDGWSIEAGGHALRPPSSHDAIGRAFELRVAPSAEACATSGATLTVLATDSWPQLDAASVVWSPDDGRLDLKGHNLAGVSVTWRGATQAGSDVCRDPKLEGGSERCGFAVGAGAQAVALVATSFSWWPAGARTSADVTSFDSDGRRVGSDAFSLVPARIVLRRLLPLDASLDLSAGQGEAPLIHPEAIASAECSAPLQCEMAAGKLIVRGAASLASTIELKLRLRPHVWLAVKDGLDAQPSVKLPVLYCPMTVVSGAPLRNNADAAVIVRLDGACARDLSGVQFTTDHSVLKVLQTLHTQDSAYAVLRLGSVSDDDLSITALRGQSNAVALAIAHTPTRSAPHLRASLELPGFPNLDFVPNNRPAVVHVSALPAPERLQLLPSEGVYEVAGEGTTVTIRGDPNAAGLTDLRFGVRNTALPDGLSAIDLAVLTDTLQRPIHEANIPAPIGASVHDGHALIELQCGGGAVPLQTVRIGVTAHLPYGLRDTCRMIFHRERLSPEYGSQKLIFEVDVIKPDGGTRSDAHVSEVFTFRAGHEPRYAYIHGVTDPFDRVVVRVSHEADEAHYIGASELKTGSPAAQWSAVLGNARARLYGTTTIPTGLYRFSTHEYSGALALNFGVISRLTWLDAEGHEGFLGAEGGVLVMGLANSTSTTGKSLTQVGGVVGLGVSVPIANRSSLTQASISLHLWFESDITRDPGASSRGRYAMIFGPSISIGNVGTNL